MTLASWLISLQQSGRRRAREGGHPNRSRALNRSVFLEALEDRRLLSSLSFSAGSETIDESAGKFSVPVTLSGAPTVSTFASGMSAPYGLAFHAGNLYVADIGDGTVSKVTPAGVVTTFASGFGGPRGLAFDDAGNLYVSNLNADSVSEVTPAGVVTTFASGFNLPVGLAFDGAGNLYVANLGNNTVSEVTPAGVVTTFASGLSGPVAMAFDATGNLFVSDSSNSSVSEVTPAGAVTTFASGLSGPIFLAFDATGNLYVADSNPGTVEEVTPAGVVTTFVSGFETPAGLAFDAAGNLYAANYGDNTVSEVSETATVPFTLGGTAVSGTDYSGVTAGPLTFASGQTTATITGTLLSDPGPSQTLSFTLGTPTGGSDLGSPAVNTLTITEPGLLQFSTGGETVNEATGTFSIPVTLSGGPSSGTVTVPFTLGGTAVSGTDYSGVTASPLTFAGGQTTETITGTLLSDPGPSQTLTVTLGTPTGDSALGSLAVNTLTIAEPGLVTFSTGSETVNEATGTFSIPVTLSGTPGDTVTVPFTLGGTAVSGTAFSGVTASPLSFGIGQTTETITGTLLSDPGPSQTLSFTLGTPTGGSDLGSAAVNTLTIAEPGLVTFSTGSETVNEATGTFSIPVTLSGAPGDTVTVPFTLGGTAVSGTAYSSLTASPLSFGIGQTTATITGTLLSDPGPGQTLSFTLGTPTGGSDLGTSSVNTLTIAEPGLVTFSTGSETVNEATGTFSIPVTLSGSPGDTVTVPFTLGGTAVSGTAYSGLTTSPLSFGIGQTTATITGTLLSDAGPSQTLTFTLGTPTGGSDLGSAAVNTLTITEPPTPTSTPTPHPTIIGEQPVFARKLNKKGKPTGKPVLTGYTFEFSSPLNPLGAGNAANYQVDTITTKRVKKRTVKILRPLSGFRVSYTAASDVVSLTLAGKPTFAAGGQITVLAGVTGLTGSALAGPTVFAIAPNGNTITPS